jgi:hypothetical protein
MYCSQLLWRILLLANKHQALMTSEAPGSVEPYANAHLNALELRLTYTVVCERHFTASSQKSHGTGNVHWMDHSQKKNAAAHSFLDYSLWFLSKKK